MIAPEESAPIVWEPDVKLVGQLGPESRARRATIGHGVAKVWRVGGEWAWRAKVVWDGSVVGRGVTHHAREDSAKASAEKRLRKAGA